MELKTPPTAGLRALWVETPVMVRLHSAASKSPRFAGAFSFSGFDHRSALVVGRQRPEVTLELLGAEALLAMTGEDRQGRGALRSEPSEQIRDLGLYIAMDVHADKRALGQTFSKSSEMRRREMLGESLLGFPFLEDSKLAA
jgi:hypothetical protein